MTKKKKLQSASPERKKTTVKKTAVKKGMARRITEKERTPAKIFPIVGIGGSAGGLEALSELLQHLPTDLGMAYVYIQHLSPNHQSLLPEIIQRKTKMKVVKVKDGMPLEKNTVYVMPARYSITIADGKLKLAQLSKQNNIHVIDHFLTSLAPVYQQSAIGIILSGTGSDGTLGLTAIKAEGGITFAQDDSATYQSMPYHAIQMGYVDFVLSPEQIAKELASFAKHPYTISPDNGFFNKEELGKLFMIMNNRRGIDFSQYKHSTIHRRILRRMALNRMKDVSAYVRLLKDNKAETNALYQDLLITVTDFFRDAGLYKALTTKILPALIKGRKASEPIRIWIPGCATGEEAVSFAISVIEFLGDKAITTPVQIFATDLNEKSVEKARAGIYLKNSLQNVSQQRLRRFFIKLDGHYQVAKAIRDMCIFAPHNLLKDPPFSRMDIISCQNVLIYLETASQNRIMHAFHYALKPTGFLLLGKSETIGNATDLFKQASRQYKIYSKRSVSTPQLDFIARTYPSYHTADQQKTDNEPAVKLPDLERETDKLLLSRYVPASVLINKDLEILRFRGSTSRYLEPAAGKASLHLLKMVKEDLAFDLRTAIHKAKRENVAVKREGIVFGNNGTMQEIGIEVLPLKGLGKDVYYLIVFKERPVVMVTGKKGQVADAKSKIVGGRQIENLEAQLKEARDTIKIITEDFDATREELQSANEEVLSSNEELQSINEELETSKEELQSSNEELTTINEELHIRNTELKEAIDYTNAIVETVHESLLMMTVDLKIRTANKGFYQTFQASPEKTEGHYLYELGEGEWDIPELRQQLELLRSRGIPLTNFEMTHEFAQVGRKSIILNAHQFLMKEGSQSMILLAIQDITERKRIEQEIKENEERFRLLLQNAFDVITVFDAEGTIKYISAAIESVLGYAPEKRIGKSIINDPILHPDDRKIKDDMFMRSMSQPDENVHAEFRMRHANGTYRTIDAICRNLLADNRINGIIATYRDITDRKLLEVQKDEFIGIVSHELKTPVTSIKAYAQVLQQNFLQAKDKNSAALLGKMDAQVDKLTALIVDLLDFTRIEGGELKMREEYYDINEMINEVTEEMQRTTRKHRIEKKLDENVRLWGDRYRTGQVLTNLIGNAIKYSPESKRIIISTKKQSDVVVVCVQDFGVGISDAMQKNIFDRFYRGSDPHINTYPGLGLGLYIASQIIKNQQGQIWVESKKGKGSKFFFSLPINKK